MPLLLAKNDKLFRRASRARRRSDVASMPESPSRRGRWTPYQIGHTGADHTPSSLSINVPTDSPRPTPGAYGEAIRRPADGLAAALASTPLSRAVDAVSDGPIRWDGPDRRFRDHETIR
jgi:hypothetical protein